MWCIGRLKYIRLKFAKIPENSNIKWHGDGS